MARSPSQQSVTLVELVIVMVLTSLLAVTIAPLMWRGVQTFVFLPRAAAVSRVATELLHAVIEESYSTLSGFSGQSIRGLRYAAPQKAQATLTARSAIWLADANRIGFLIPNDPWVATDNRYVVLQLDAGLLKRKVFTGSTPPACPPPTPDATWELIPYDAAATIPVTVVAPALFSYADTSGTTIAPPGCTSASAIRRVTVACVAQTGNGKFDEGNAKLTIQSMVAIRFP